MYLKACLNGARRPEEHPRLPVSADDIAADAARALAAGAEAIHLHAKDDAGSDTLDADALALVLRAVRRACPATSVGVTTGAWSCPDPGERRQAVERWTELPDFASVNWHEAGAEQVAEALLRRGVAVEAGVWHVDAARAWSRSPLRDACFRVLVELPDGVADRAVVMADAILRALGDPAADTQVLLHGEGASCWPALRHAARRGLASRIGLEDTLLLPDGTPAPDNASLVRAARALVGLRDRCGREEQPRGPF